METWVSVFLAIIALQTLLQAGFVVGLVLGARRGGQALSEVEHRVARDLSRHATKVTTASERAAVAAESAHEHAERAGAALAEAGQRMQGLLDRASGVVSRAAVREEHTQEDGDEEEDGAEEGRFALPGPLGQGLAFLHGARRAWEVWRQSSDGDSPEVPSSPS